MIPIQHKKPQHLSHTSAKSTLGVLLVANYSNCTGYAWNNIYQLFEQIALECQGHGLSPWVSFAKFEPPLDWKNANVFKEILELPPIPSSIRELLIWIRTIRHYEIRYLYLTDQNSWSFRYALFRLAGIRKIIVHNRVSVPDPRPAIPESKITGAVKWFMCRLPFIQATRVYAVSEFVRNRLIVKSKLPSKRVVTILNGVDLTRFAPQKKISRQAGFIRIFCGGRATQHKGIGVLIEATGLLRDRFHLTDFVVAYAGKGPDLATFIERAEKLKLREHFKFLGEFPATETLVRNADIIVVPSVWGDACPSTISEALAAGKPLIATRVGGVPEQIGDEASAIMVEPGDSIELAETLARLIRNPEERKLLAIRGRRRAEQALDQRRYYREVLSQLYRDMDINLINQDKSKKNHHNIEYQIHTRKAQTSESHARSKQDCTSNMLHKTRSYNILRRLKNRP